MSESPSGKTLGEKIEDALDKFAPTFIAIGFFVAVVLVIVAKLMM